MSQDWLEPGSDVILLDEVGSSNRLVRFQDGINFIFILLFFFYSKFKINKNK